MTQILNRYATPFITWFFIISLISGVALFFHIGPTGFREMHEILSLVLILPFALHIWKNWRPIVCYFRHAPMVIALAISAVAAGVFLIPTGETTAGGPPPFVYATRMLQGTPAEIAAVLDVTPEAVTTALTTAGITASDPAQTVHDMAAASGSSDSALFEVLAGLKP